VDAGHALVGRHGADESVPGVVVGAEAAGAVAESVDGGVGERVVGEVLGRAGEVAASAGQATEGGKLAESSVGGFDGAVGFLEGVDGFASGALDLVEERCGACVALRAFSQACFISVEELVIARRGEPCCVLCGPGWWRSL